MSGISKKAKLFLAKCSIFEIETNKNDESESLLAVLQVEMMKLLESFKDVQTKPTLVTQKESDLPQNSKRKVIKRKFISASKSKKLHKCPHCEKSFVHIQSLSFHVKAEHAMEGTKIVSKDFTFGEDEDDRTPCLMRNKKTGKLCNKLFQTHQMPRHLKSHPEAESQPPKKKFKGFITSNNGESHEVVWRGPGEDNPPSEEEIEVSDTDESDETNSKQDDLDEDKTEVDPGDNVFKSEIDTSDSNNQELTSVSIIKKVPGVGAKVEVDKEDLESKVVIEVKKVLSSIEMQEYSPPKLDVVLTEVTTDECEKDQKMLLFDDTDSPYVFTPPEPSVFVEVPSQSSQILFDEIEINSSFGLIKTQESELYELTCDVIENDDTVKISMEEEKPTTQSMDSSGSSGPFYGFSSQEADGAAVSQSLEQFCSQSLSEFFESEKDEDNMENEEEKAPASDVQSTSDKTVKVQYFTTKVKRGEFWCAPDINSNDTFNPDDMMTDVARDKNQNLIGSDFNDEEEEITDDINNIEDNDNEEESDDEDNVNKSSYFDTDYEMDDDEEFTNHRLEMKKVRRLKRNISTAYQEVSERPGNEKIITNFKEFLVRQCHDESKSTVSLTMGHMFYYNDSWLHLMTSKDRSFTLDRLLDFKNSRNFITTSSPLNWLAVTGGPTGKDQPSRQLEQLKAHGRFRSYLEYKANEEVFDGGEGMMKKILFVQNNAAIAAEIERLKIRNKLNKWYNFEKNKKRRMKKILNPETDINVYEAVKTWFGSAESKEKEEEAVKIWKTAIKSQSVTQKNFNKVAVLSRFTTAICDKSRPGAYRFKNSDYDSKTPVWFPEDSENDIWSLDALPANWRLYSPPDPNTEPTCFEIKLDGSQASLKGQAAVTVVVNRKCYQIMEMCQDLKKIMYKKQKKAMSMDDQFFVNFKLAPLSRLQRRKGNLLDLFGQVTQIPNFKMTDLRKAVEAVIQSRSALTEIGKDLNYHHENVVPVYDNISSTRRMIFNTTLNNKEGSSAMSVKQIEDEDGSIKDHLIEKKGREKDEEIKRKEEAKMFLESEKLKKKVVDLTPFQFEEEILAFLRTIFNDFNLKGLDFILATEMIVICFV